MNYAVIWLPITISQLATIWVDAVDRNAVTNASAEIDRRLSYDPWNEGESRNDDDRLMLIPPLQVLYRIDEADRVVYVTSVGVF